MTKQELQQELLEKVKPGTKPSHLKRSKSESDIPKAPRLPLSESELLRQQEEDSAKQIEELKKATDLNTLLQEQLKEKQKEIESLRKQLEPTNPNPSDLTELDQS